MMHDMRRLAAENEMLRWRVSELEALLHQDWMPPASWGLTISQTKMLRLLLSKDVVSMTNFVQVVYPDDLDREPNPRVISAFLHQLRRKLAVLDVAIGNRWGEGWHISSMHKDRLLEFARIMR